MLEERKRCTDILGSMARKVCDKMTFEQRLGLRRGEPCRYQGFGESSLSRRNYVWKGPEVGVSLEWFGNSLEAGGLERRERGEGVREATRNTASCAVARTGSISR